MTLVAASLAIFSISVCRSEGATIPYAGWRCLLSSHPSELGREPCLAPNEPGDKRKDEAYGQSTHQYASATFYYTQNSPRPGKK
jgi:hypothetical protein